MTMAPSWVKVAVFGMGAVLLGAGCGPTELNGLGAGSGTDGGRGAGASPAAAHADAPELEQKASIHAAYLAARMKEAAHDVRYAIEPSKAAPLAARSWSKGFEGNFDERGVALSAEGQDWKGRLDVVRFGCDDRLHDVTSGAPVRDAKTPNRLEYVRHAGKETFTEWWVNGEPGIEQGFTVERSPCAVSARELTIEVRVDGLTPAMRDGKTEGGAVELRGEDGGVRLRYADLYAYDAAGEVLPARMVVTEGRVALRVAVDGGTRWPVVVDPVVATQEAKLLLEIGAATDEFGVSVSVSGDTALVGAYYDDVGANADQGSAYVYVRSGTMWYQQAHLTASDGAAQDYFGSSVSVSGDTALVGAARDIVGANAYQGSAYVYVRNGTTWTQQAHLTASDGAADDFFGSSVSVSGDTALVGADRDTVGANMYQGSAYVYVRSGTMWSEQGHLTASDGAARDYFGSSVSVSGDTALVGAENDAVGANMYQGSGAALSTSDVTVKLHARPAGAPPAPRGTPSTRPSRRSRGWRAA